MIQGFERFIAIDVETTGLEKDAHIIEIAMVAVNDGKVVDHFQSFVRPPKAIPRDISQLTGITNHMVSDAPTWKDIEDDVLAFIGDRLLVAHNVEFDRNRLAFEIGHHLPNDWLDTHDLAKLFLPTLTSYKLVAIASHLNIEDNAHHRAYNDALVCAAVAVRLLANAHRIDLFTLSDMYALFADKIGALPRLLKTLCHDSTGANHLKEDVLFDSDESFGSEPALSFEHAADFFEPEGILAQNFSQYEPRPQQQEMLGAICDAFKNERHCIVEAGTGTGKSFAYLIPALLWGYEHNTRVIVSTATIALQEQLYQSDIPFLRRLLNYPFAATITKGRTNYLCQRRFANVIKQVETLTWNERLFYASLIYWQSFDDSGDREHLNLNKMENQFWVSIAATSDTCFGHRCPAYRDCFYFGNRRKAENSQLVIVNHSLLLQDARLDGGVLPTHEHIIIDEAHHLENEAGRQFTDELDFELVRKSLVSMTRPAGLFKRIQSQSAKSTELSFDYPEIERTLSQTHKECKEAADQLATVIDTACNLPELANIGERRITEKVRRKDWWLSLADTLTRLLNQLRTVVHHLNKLHTRIRDDDDLEAVVRELHFATTGIEQSCLILERFLAGTDDDFVYWAKSHRAGWGNTLLFYTAYIDVMPLLQDKLFAKNNSIILTSATLAINHDLDYTAKKYLLEPDEYVACVCESPFDHEKQSFIAIPTDHPDYSQVSDIAYSQNIANDLAQLIPAVKGDMLVLFTSYAMLNRVYFMLKKNRDLRNYTILGHGQDGSRSSIINRMQKERHTVILGAASFWEGVDVPGEHLRTVVITKLPFAPPSQPLESARAELLQSEGKNAFAHLSLPQAILRFRQGCGRLLRSAQDWGAIVILDNRVISKSYGKQFIGSLPKQPVIKNDMPTISRELQQFMANHENKTS